MILSLLIFAIGLLAILFFVHAAKGRAGFESKHLEKPTEALQKVDVDAFRNLMDPEEESYLRASLPRAEFRRLQRERNRAAIEYITGVSQNAAILTRVGEIAQRSPEASAVEAGEKLVAAAVRLRLFAFHAKANLYLGLILPGGRISTLRIADGYEQMTRLVILISCLEQTNRRVAVEL